MGFVKRYWREAEEKNIPHWHKCAIVELKTGEARVQVRGYVNIGENFMTECPKTFVTYEEAFAWLERKLTKRAVDLGDSVAFLALSTPEVLSTYQADSTPAPIH